MKPGTQLPPPLVIFVKFTDDMDENRRRVAAHKAAWDEWHALYGGPRYQPHEKYQVTNVKLNMNDSAFYDFISIRRNVVVNGQVLPVSWLEQPEHIKDVHRRKFANNNQLLWLDIKRWWRDWQTTRRTRRHRKKYGFKD